MLYHNIILKCWFELTNGDLSAVSWQVLQKASVKNRGECSVGAT